MSDSYSEAYDSSPSICFDRQRGSMSGRLENQDMMALEADARYVVVVNVHQADTRAQAARTLAEEETMNAEEAQQSLEAQAQKVAFLEAQLMEEKWRSDLDHSASLPLPPETLFSYHGHFSTPTTHIHSVSCRLNTNCH
ncbi:hypothetical protein L218DRAFT_1003375 [Marasmius fiardii PR-910]|nr:hypothetical protein L218DRAFT_1003375 [Marasmius fiardii PR-910]